MVRFYNRSLRFIAVGAVAITCLARVNSYPKIGGGVPAGMVAAIAGACPSGWSEYTAARGRYVVGVPAGGTVEAVVGTALNDKEDRGVAQHTHPISYNSTHSHTVDLTHDHFLTPWATSGVIVLNGSYTFNQYGSSLGSTSSASPAWNVMEISETIPTGWAGSVASTTNAPYVQLRLCVKN